MILIHVSSSFSKYEHFHMFIQDDDPNAYSTDREEEPVHPG